MVCYALIAVAFTCGCGGGGDVVSAGSFPFERAAGEALGQEITAALPDGGLLLVLMREDLDHEGWLRQEALLNGLRYGAGNFLPQNIGPNLRGAGAKKLEIEQQVAAGGWPSRQYVKWCRANRSAVAVASLVEFPSDIKAGDLSGVPPLFVFSTHSADTLRGLVEQGAVRAAIVPRADADLSAGPPRNASPAEVTAVRYEILAR